jgi:integrase/recombinase XerC
MGRGCEWGSPSPVDIDAFLNTDRTTALAAVNAYKSHLIKKGLSEATINSRLSAIKSFIDYARRAGYCEFSLDDVKGEKVVAYRDTTGITVEEFRKVLEGCDQSTASGARDYAILRLLWDNALRRGEIVKLKVKDFSASDNKLKIYGKGRGGQGELISLSTKTTEAIQNWLGMRGRYSVNSPLFVAIDSPNKQDKDKEISGQSITDIVKKYCNLAGITKPMSPHRLRHSSITAALEATGGDVRKVQKLSRHRKLDTLMIYDDRREGIQEEMSKILSDLV